MVAKLYNKSKLTRMKMRKKTSQMHWNQSAIFSLDLSTTVFVFTMISICKVPWSLSREVRLNLWTWERVWWMKRKTRSTTSSKWSTAMRTKNERFSFSPLLRVRYTSGTTLSDSRSSQSLLTQHWSHWLQICWKDLNHGPRVALKTSEKLIRAIWDRSMRRYTNLTKTLSTTEMATNWATKAQSSASLETLLSDKSLKTCHPNSSKTSWKNVTWKDRNWLSRDKRKSNLAKQWNSWQTVWLSWSMGAEANPNQGPSSLSKRQSAGENLAIKKCSNHQRSQRSRLGTCLLQSSEKSWSDVIVTCSSDSRSKMKLKGIENSSLWRSMRKKEHLIWKLPLSKS